MNGASGTTGFRGLAIAFVAAFAMFFAQQVLTPLHSSLGMVIKNRVDGHAHDRLIDVSLRSAGIGPLEDQETWPTCARQWSRCRPGGGPRAMPAPPSSR